MKQIVLEAPGRFAVRHTSAPIPSSDRAIVQVRKVGLCGSDFHAFAGRHPAYIYPRILGHELSGIVVEVSVNDCGIRTTDSCAIDPYISCGSCRTCIAGRSNCCEYLKVIGVHIDGGMQEFLSVPVSQLHKSEKVSLDELALVETLGVGAHAVVRAGIVPGQEVLVVGAGPIGIGVAQFALLAGATVLIVEKNDSRREFVERMGYDVSPVPGDRLADVVFDATGNAEAMKHSLSLVAAGGTLVFVGLTSDPIYLDDSLFHRREIRLLASRNSSNQFPRIIQLLEQGKVNPKLWVTDHLSLSEVASGFERLPKKKLLIKAIVDVPDGRL